jgi:hypothetical protein
MKPATTVRSVLQRITASLVMVILVGGLLSGCQTAQTQPGGTTDDPAAVSPEHRRIINKKQIARGFTPLEVELAWGKPASRKTSEDELKQIWYYTAIVTVSHYVTVKRTNPNTGLEEYVEEPYPVKREMILRTVDFEEGLVARWKIYPLSNRLINELESGNVGTQ